ncbi:MAG TPA: nickel-dependent lactate racemase [Bacillota bacterium]|nr:nickel-dependent lactate racemase [Bacillota bacterium]HOH09597.1 nickel-dependent lactate racemase [Bacillota bacterium]HOS49870.1 nickel-dependent lactate racemase [Bacillota bacterium]
MSIDFKFKYGDDEISVGLPKEAAVRSMLPRPCEKLTDWKGGLEAALDAPIGSPRLEDIVSPGESVAILVPDVTRIWSRTWDYLPAVLRRLKKAGIKDGDVRIINACGTHRKNRPEELERILGGEAFGKYSLSQNDPDGPTEYMGTTSLGTPVLLNAEAMGADRLVMLGGVVHHAMAGYGGGRKMVLPGISSRQTVKANHVWVLDPDKPGIRPGVGSALTKDNPLHHDMVEAASFAKPSFIVNSATDAEGDFAGFYAGHWQEAWERGCRKVDDMYCVDMAGRADFVLASCGGFPRDISVYQASKAFYNAWMAAKPGAKLVLFMEARDGGGGDEFFKWFEYPTIEEFHKALLADFTIAGYMAFLVYYIATVTDVTVVTGMQKVLLDQMHVKFIRPEEAASRIPGMVSPGDDILYMPESAITLPVDTTARRI